MPTPLRNDPRTPRTPVAGAAEAPPPRQRTKTPAAKPPAPDQFRQDEAPGATGQLSQSELDAFLAVTSVAGKGALDVIEPAGVPAPEVADAVAPKSPEEALELLAAALANTDAFVNLDPEGRLTVSFATSSLEEVEAAAQQAGVIKSATAFRDLYRLGDYEVILSQDQAAGPTTW